MVSQDYLKGILEQIIDSYQILNELKDEPGDLGIIKTELLKINGLFRVIMNKLNATNIQSDNFVKLSNRIKHYLGDYEFEREINTMSTLYSEDSNRLKNIRLKIIEALEDKKLMETVNNIFQAE